MLVFLAEYGSLNIGVEHKGYVAYSFRFDDEFWEKTAAESTVVYQRRIKHSFRHITSGDLR